MTVVKPSLEANSRLAYAVVVTGILSGICLALFFALGSDNVFGPLNDITSGLLAILSGVLASLIYAHFRDKFSWLGLVITIGAWIGALFILTGTVLVLSRFTGWVLAGLYSTTGYAFIGLWLLGFNSTARRGRLLPDRLTSLGLISGAIMILGFAAVPGIFARIDSLKAYSPVLNILWQSAGLGTLLFLVWCFGLGAAFRRVEIGYLRGRG